MAQEKNLLIDYPEEFRYLVESNYKIIYWKKENLITIDYRQNPGKIRKEQSGAIKYDLPRCGG